MSTKIGSTDVKVSYPGCKNLRDAVIAIMYEVFRITCPVLRGCPETRLLSLRVNFFNYMGLV